MGFQFKQWYNANGKQLNEKRQARYNSDPEYRQKVLASNAESREKRRKSGKKVAAKKRKPKTDPKPYKVVEAVVDGSKAKLFTIGLLAKELGCSIQAIRLWERNGVIPEAPLRSGSGVAGDRLYTDAAVKIIKEVLLAQGRISRNRSKDRPTIRALTRYVRYADGRVEQVQLFLVGVLARAVNRNVVTLEQLESRGAIPVTPFRASSVKRRLYTADMIEAVQRAFEARGDVRGEAHWKVFHEDIEAAWTAQGVIGASLVEAAPSREESAADDNERRVDAE